jgi:hypothetical protein
MSLSRALIVPALATCLFSITYAMDEAQVRALEQQCETAREERIKPLRDAEIAKCKADKRNDPAYCERFWSDYGDPVRLRNGRMQPRLFGDLPECVTADEARRKLKRVSEQT